MSDLKTIALRFAENFAPREGTIAAHQEVIDKLGYVWYGKLGSPISDKVANDILKGRSPRILLIHSGGQDRFWAHIDSVQRCVPEGTAIPDYYRCKANEFSCWFRVISFERAQSNVMSRCIVASSKKPLTLASRHSMSPYFIIEYQGEE